MKPARAAAGWLLGAALVLRLVALPGTGAEPPPPGAGGPDAAGPRLGLVLPPSDPFREAVERGARLALDRYNRSRPVPARLWIAAQPGQWGGDGEEAGRLVLDEGVQVLISPPDSATTHLVLQVAGRTRTPVIALCPDSSVTGAGIPWALQVVPSTRAQGAALFAGGGRWRVRVSEDRPGRAAFADLVRAARGNGASLEPDPVVPPAGSANPQDPGPGSGTEPGLVLWLPPAAAAAAFRSGSETRRPGRVCGPSFLRDPAFLDGAGPGAEGVLVPAMEAGDAETAQVRTAWAEAYRSRHGTAPPALADDAAEAVGLALALIDRAGGRPVAAAFPVGAGALGRGVTGPWEFEPSGERRVRLRVAPLGEHRVPGPGD